jgi:hypothetical protein
VHWVVRGLLIIAALLTSVNALAKERAALLPHTNEGYGYKSVVPEGWTDVGKGIFARQRDAEDSTLFAQQSAPGSAEDVLASLLPQLGLTEALQGVGTHQGDALEWTLYQVDVALAKGEVAVDLALSHKEDTTYIVLLESAPDEHDALHESIFLPTLNAFAPLVETVEDVPYRVEAVTFGNGDVTLAGTLTLPPTPGPHPAVVLVSGSGPQDRDEALGGGIAIKPFRLLADALTREGVAVLRYDDRGVGASTGTFSTAVVSDFASDAEAAIDYLLTRKEIDPRQIGVLGHSEGSLVAAMLGARNDDLDFIISLAGPGVNGRDLLLVQNQRILKAEGATKEQIDAQLAFVEELTKVLDDPAAVEVLIYARTLEQAKALPDAERAALGDLEDYAQRVAKQAMSEFATDWFASFLAYDPAPDWAQTTVPVLAIFGGKDVQVDAKQNAPALEDALKRAGNDDVEIAVLPNANHLFQEAGTGSPREYATLPAEFTPDLVPTIVSWLQDHLEIAA